MATPKDDTTAPLVGENTRPALLRTTERTDNEALSAEQRDTVLHGLRSGQSLASVLLHNPALPGATVIHRERRKDAAFAQAYQEAREDGLEAAIEEASDYQFAVRGHKQLSIAAAKYADTVHKSAALLAPKKFSPQLKLSDSNGDKLSLVLVNYSPAEAVALEAQTIEAPTAGQLSAPQQSGQEKSVE